MEFVDQLNLVFDGNIISEGVIIDRIYNEIWRYLATNAEKEWVAEGIETAKQDEIRKRAISKLAKYYAAILKLKQDKPDVTGLELINPQDITFDEDKIEKVILNTMSKDIYTKYKNKLKIFVALMLCKLADFVGVQRGQIFARIAQKLLGITNEYMKDFIEKTKLI